MWLVLALLLYVELCAATTPTYVHVAQYADTECAQLAAVITLLVNDNDGSCRQLSSTNTWTTVVAEFAVNVTRLRLMGFKDTNCTAHQQNTVAMADFPAPSAGCSRNPLDTTSDIYWRVRMSTNSSTPFATSTGGIVVAIRGDDMTASPVLLQKLLVTPGACAYNPFAQTFYTVQSTCPASQSTDIFGELTTFTVSLRDGGDGSVTDPCRCLQAHV